MTGGLALQVFIPELGETFRAAPGFRLFGAQNPVSEGGGRRGLPRSFLNRFTRVAIELLREEDLLFISGKSAAASSCHGWTFGNPAAEACSPVAVDLHASVSFSRGT